MKKPHLAYGHQRFKEESQVLHAVALLGAS